MEYIQLNYPELRKVVWFFADMIRDKGRGNSNDYMAITLGVVLLKRIVDMRAEYKRKFLESGTPENKIYLLNGRDIDKAISNHQSKTSQFEVLPEKTWTYRLEWNDFCKFSDNSDALLVSKTYDDNLGGNLLETNTINKFLLLNESIQSFKHATLHEIFDTLDFIPKIYKVNADGSVDRKKQVLDLSDFEIILEELNKYNFDLSHVSEDVFSDVYMDLLGRFAADGGKKGGEFFTPTKVVRGAVKFLCPKFKPRKIVVCDPTAGACTFMVEFAKAYKEMFDEHFKGDLNVNFKDYIEFVTGEKEPVSKALGDANLLLSGYADNHVSYHANSITEYDDYLGTYAEKVDFILANPPYGLKDYGFNDVTANKDIKRGPYRWKFGIPNKGEGEYAFMSTILDLLNDEGKAVIVLPLGTLFKDITSTYREKIIEKDWLEGIIVLPEKMFHTTGIPVCLWLINKKKEEKDQGKIFFVNATNDFEKNGKLNEWSDNEPFEAFNERKNIEGYSGYININKIIENKYNLSITRYLQEIKEREEIDINAIRSDVKELISLISKDICDIDDIVIKGIKNEHD